MTEAAHQIACNPLPPGRRKPGSVGVAMGSEAAVSDADGQLLPPGMIGEIVVRGANVTRGYCDDAQANAEAFATGWFRTGDQGRIDADGYVFLTGRIKEIINRGGEKVSPREIDDALLEHPAVDQAAAFGVRHETLGEDVAAAVVLKPGARASKDQLREFLFGRLADYKIPWPSGRHHPQGRYRQGRAQNRSAAGAAHETGLRRAARRDRSPGGWHLCPGSGAAQRWRARQLSCLGRGLAARNPGSGTAAGPVRDGIVDP